MAEIKFACPACDQHIQCDSSWAGEQITCPGCQSSIVIPVAAPQPAAETAPKPKLTFAPVTHSAPTPPPAAAQPRPMAMPTFSPIKKPEDTGRMRGILQGVAILAVMGIVIAVAWPWLSSFQDDINKTRDKAREDGGGEVGHIAELYGVLDATDPDKMGMGYEPPTRSQLPPEDTRVNPPTWTLDVGAAAIPEGKANGQVAGSPFVAQSAFISKVGADYVLALRSGTLSSDRELLVYLRLKAGQPLQGSKWEVAIETKAGVPQIAKRWQPSPGAPLQQKFFSGGYALKLEFGEPVGRTLPGKIYAALPDPEQTVVGGNFTADLRLTRPGSQFDTFADE